MSDIVAIEVDSKRISGWTGVTIEQAIDNCADAFSISAPFDPERADLRERFKPFGYRPCKVLIDDQLIITGRIEKVELADSADGQTLIVQGRNSTGVLVDCYIDEVGYQFNGSKLSEVIEALLAKLNAEVDAETGKKVYDIKVEAKNDTGQISECVARPGQKIFDFIAKLAENFGLFLSSDATGTLVIREPPKKAETPVASIVAGQSPYIGGSASYDGSSRFSLYKIIVEDFGTKPVRGWATDSGVPIYRHSVELGKTTLAERKAVLDEIWSTAIHKRALALARSASITVSVSGWRDSNGILWEKGSTITLLAPALMVYQESAFIVAGITLKIDETQGRVADLRLIMPQWYQIKMLKPEDYPWA